MPSATISFTEVRLGLMPDWSVGRPTQRLSQNGRKASVYHMDVSRLPERFPLVIAHRGDSTRFPENTLPAFESAVALGADMVELDVTLSADGHPVVIHDATLDRTTNGSGPVGHHTLQDLQALDAGSWKGQSFRGITIPTLPEVFDRIGGKIAINIEIKGGTGERKRSIEARVLQVVKTYDLVSSIILSSFDYLTLKKLRRLDDRIALAVLSDEREAHDRILSKVREVGASSYNPNEKYLDPSMIAGLHRDGIVILPWAQNAHNHADTMKRVLEWGCDGFFANDPALLATLVHSCRRR